MTLLVGIRCKEGIVIAADQQVTLGSMGQATVGQRAKKVAILGPDDNQYLLASSGAVGMAQLISEAIEENSKKFRNQRAAAIIPTLQVPIRKILNPAFETAQRAVPVIGHQAAQADCLCGSLLAGQFADGHHLIEISQQGGMEILTAEVPFCCLGSGKQNADPILRFLWSIYFSESEPNLQDCLLAAYWTVDVAISMKSPSVGFATDVFSLVPGKKGSVCKQYETKELDEHHAFIQDAYAGFRSVRDKLRATPAEATEVLSPPTLVEVVGDTGAGDGERGAERVPPPVKAAS